MEKEILIIIQCRNMQMILFKKKFQSKMNGKYASLTQNIKYIDEIHGRINL